MINHHQTRVNGSCSSPHVVRSEADPEAVPDAGSASGTEEAPVAAGVGG